MNAIVDIIETLIPICVMYVLPIMVVWLITRARVKKNDQKMAVLVKAIENGVEIDPELLISETESSRNTKMKLIRKLTTGVVCFIIGVALLICPSLDTFEDVAGLRCFISVVYFLLPRLSEGSSVVQFVLAWKNLIFSAMCLGVLAFSFSQTGMMKV